jgi:hypothetical protein
MSIYYEEGAGPEPRGGPSGAAKKRAKGRSRRGSKPSTARPGRSRAGTRRRPPAPSPRVQGLPDQPPRTPGPEPEPGMAERIPSQEQRAETPVEPESLEKRGSPPEQERPPGRTV